MEPAISLEAPVLPARGPEDLLAYVGHALGRLPVDSLVLITLGSGRLRAVVRVDLPRPGAPEDGWTRAVARVCRQDAEADAVLVLALPGGPTPPLLAPVWGDALGAALASAGRPLAAGWTCGAGRARPWSGPQDTSEQTVHPRTAPLSLHLMARGSVWDRASVPEPVPSAEATAHAGPASRWPAPTPEAEAARESWLDRWESVLSGATAGPSPAEAAGLGGPLTCPAWRDALVLRAARRPGERTAAGPERALVLTASSARPPAWDRLDRLRAALRGLVPAAPREVAAHALALAGWVGWARGHGTDAVAHLAAATELLPDDPFVAVLRRVVASGCVAGWAVHPDSAWRPGV